jgi:hypothetical protein
VAACACHLVASSFCAGVVAPCAFFGLDGAAEDRIDLRLLLTCRRALSEGARSMGD